MEPFGHGLPVVLQARFPRMHLKPVEELCILKVHWADASR